MKSILAKGLMLAVLSSSMSAYALDRQQHDTVVGAALGGAAGAVIGQNVVSTVAGAALGGVIGSQWNAHSKSHSHDDRPHHKHHRDDHHDRPHHPVKHGPHGPHDKWDHRR
ncbi:glycine zipper 2TM domain-containing protein [Pasteurellaceae bacterium LIM206]|nr:glycine zipper 2TM domain-containing protein [Pasteurellaceae bacterium LIM206]